MNTVTIEKVENGYLVKSGDKTYVAESINGYTFASVEKVLRSIFEPPREYQIVDPKALGEAA